MNERLDRIIAEVRRRGRRVTPQRVAIIGSFLARRDHPTAEQVHADLKATYPMMALSTVYDTLHLLVELGEAVEVSPATADRRFDPNTGDHRHLVCLRCGAIADWPLPDTAVQPRVTASMEAAGFRPVRRLYQEFGYCARCQSEAHLGARGRLQPGRTGSPEGRRRRTR